MDLPLEASGHARQWSKRLRHSICGLVGLGLILILCNISHAVLWDRYRDRDRANPLYSERNPPRQLAYLDTGNNPAGTHIVTYGHQKIDPNYNALLHPSDIDSSVFRSKQNSNKKFVVNKGYADDESACENVLLFLPHSFAHTGHANQLNNYLLAAMIATYADRAMIVLEAPPAMNEFMSNSQFGCPPEVWGDPNNAQSGWNDDFPNGLSRLVKHPAWLSRQCSVPCQTSHTYQDWDELRKVNVAGPIPEEVTCTNDDGTQSNVIVMGGKQVRDYFQSHYKEQMLDRRPPQTLTAAAVAASTLRRSYEWALRLGAAPAEARIFSGLTDRRDIWDSAGVFLARAGILRFQPWIARDVEKHITQYTKLPLDAPYDGIHVRRGDKLAKDGKFFVRNYWDQRGQYDKETGSMPQNYIPFTQYLRHLQTYECNIDGENPRLVYVATDDPLEVQSEINELPKDSQGYTLLPKLYDASQKRGIVGFLKGAWPTKSACHKLQFIFSPIEPSLGFHIETGRAKDNCDERYSRNIASIADLMILTKSDVFVGEYNSNWGRLVHMFRLKMNDSAEVKNGAKPVVETETKVAWGSQNPGPPGW